VFFANLMVFAGVFGFALCFHVWRTIPFGPIAFWATGIAALVGVFHFAFVRAKTLNDMLEAIGAKNADPKDQYHQEFIRQVSEAEAATGIHGIRPVVLETPGCNAFSLQDGKGSCAIGATEGLLSKLTAQELSSVIAHEAAHLIHEDSRLVSTATFLFSIFGGIHAALGEMMKGSRNVSSGRGSGGAIFIIMLLWAVSGFGYLLTKLIGMAISREREYLADADGVALCKDPLSLAESLYKISHRYRGDAAPAFSAVFILDPQASELAEQDGFMATLFSTHPPVDKRLVKLLNWAKSDLKTLQALDEKEADVSPSKASVVDPSSAPGGQGFMAYMNNQWMGPYNGPQLLALGTLTPGTWVCPAGSQDVQKASQVPLLLPLFQQQVQGSVTGEKCPRCRVSLVEQPFEGVQVEKCNFCGGYLLRAGVLDRLIVRDPGNFDPVDVQKAKDWRDHQRGPLNTRDVFPGIQCPFCQGPMGKTIHSSLTQVVIDRCSNDSCRALWCDSGELETILMLIKEAKNELK
jgi:heat shock protein HtpX